jgi:hypothetical protein
VGIVYCTGEQGFHGGKAAVLLLLMLGLAACGRSESRVDPVFEPYVQRFAEEAEKRDRSVDRSDLIVEFDPELKTSGKCTLEPRPHIRVKTADWEKADDTLKEAILFHELGHCLLGRVHLDLLDEDRTPRSLMTRMLIDSGTYAKKRDHYVEELFSGAPEPEFSFP